MPYLPIFLWPTNTEIDSLNSDVSVCKTHDLCTFGNECKCAKQQATRLRYALLIPCHQRFIPTRNRLSFKYSVRIQNWVEYLFAYSNLYLQILFSMMKIEDFIYILYTMLFMSKTYYMFTSLDNQFQLFCKILIGNEIIFWI